MVDDPPEDPPEGNVVVVDDPPEDPPEGNVDDGGDSSDDPPGGNVDDGGDSSDDPPGGNVDGPFDGGATVGPPQAATTKARTMAACFMAGIWPRARPIVNGQSAVVLPFAVA